MMTNDTDLAVQLYLDTIQKLSNQHYAERFPSLNPPRYYIMKGRKYHRVVQQDRDTHRSVHAFIGSDGMLYKAAGWAAPAKDARYNLLTDMETIAERFDPYGGYLYKR